MYWSPHTMCWDQLSSSPFASVVAGVTPIDSHHSETGAPVSIAFASAIAPAALIAPAPCVRASTFGSGAAVNSRIAFTVFGAGVRPPFAERLDRMMSATTPVVTAAAILVPLNVMYVRVATSTYHAG